MNTIFDNTMIDKLQELRDIALYKAQKYRWDPALSETHNEYLTLITKLLNL